ncbi:hypothetical protein B0H10DRAFT_2075369 [Mycena sp. CBHHK59/15]|nr:hypothetical protein B0H10DRAFT_2075369 [Mycena sp. CBHHK59/15]
MANDTARSPLKGARPPAGLPQYVYQPPYYHAVPPPGPIVYTQYPRYRSSPLRRFLIALLVAVGIWALASVAMHAAVHHRHRHWGHRWNIPPGVVVDRCVGGSAWALAENATPVLQPSSPPAPMPQPSSRPVPVPQPLSNPNLAEAEFELPLDSASIVLLARQGSSWFPHWMSTSMSGKLEIATSPDLQYVARVIFSSPHGRLDYAGVSACLISRGEGETGVGIFTPNSWTGFGSASYNVRLIFPESSNSSSSLRLKGLVTDLPNFSHDVGNLKDIEFKTVSFKTSNSHVHVQSLFADHATLSTSNGAISANSLVARDITLRTSNAGISGSFNVTGSLDLHTSNAPIAVRVGLESRGRASPARLTMRTSNNRLQSDISLASPQRRGGSFGVTATTSNGRLDMRFLESPRDAALDVTARTSNSPAALALHSAYEGAFAADTSNAPASVRRLHAGEEEKEGRVMEVEQVRRQSVRGVAYWEKGHMDYGMVRLRASNSPVVLSI